MSQVQQLEQQVQALQRTVRRLTALVVLVSCGILAAALAPQDSVLTVRGLVVTDASGRERVVLGAPMSATTEDPKLAEATGVAILDSLGQMSVALGAQNPLVLEGGRMGTRIAASAGLTIYDPRDGKERGGMSAFEDGRANLCLDYDESQKEAACLSVAPGDQYAAVILNGTPGEPQYDRVVMFVGADGGGSIKVFGGGENNGGVMMRAGSGMPTVTVYDTTGTPVGDLAASVGGPGSGSEERTLPIK
jgi:hypothetical protein